MLDAFPGSSRGITSYAAYVGLYLNRDRVLLRRAYSQALGAAVAAGGEAPPAWYEALTDTPMDQVRAQAEADAAAAMRKRGR